MRDYAGAEVAQLREPPCWVLLLKDCSFAVFPMGVSENRGTPKSSILMGFSHINYLFSKCFVHFAILFDDVCLASLVTQMLRPSASQWMQFPMDCDLLVF